MNKLNTRKLLQAFPALYADYDKPMTETCMCWGFECGDGWFDLLWKLSSDIEAEARKEGRVPNSGNWPRAAQVKEKFGGLRFYLDNSSDVMQEIISQAEELSYTICEDCGLPGRLHEDGWYQTLCNVCEDMRKRKG